MERELQNTNQSFWGHENHPSPIPSTGDSEESRLTSDYLPPGSKSTLGEPRKKRSESSRVETIQNTHMKSKDLINKKKIRCTIEGCGRSYGHGRSLRRHLIQDHHIPAQALINTKSKDSPNEASSEQANNTQCGHEQKGGSRGKSSPECESIHGSQSIEMEPFTEVEKNVIALSLAGSPQERSSQMPEYFRKNGKLRINFIGMESSIKKFENACKNCKEQVLLCQPDTTLANGGCTACRIAAIHCTLEYTRTGNKDWQGNFSDPERQNVIKSHIPVVEINNSEMALAAMRSNSNLHEQEKSGKENNKRRPTPSMYPNVSQHRDSNESDALDELGESEPQKKRKRCQSLYRISDGSQEAITNWNVRTAVTKLNGYQTRFLPNQVRDGRTIIDLRPAVIRYGHEMLDDNTLFQCFDDLLTHIDQYLLHIVELEQQRLHLPSEQDIYGEQGPNNGHIPILRDIFNVPAGISIKNKLISCRLKNFTPTRLIARALLAWLVQNVVFSKESFYPANSIMADLFYDIGGIEVQKTLIQEYRFRMRHRDPNFQRRIDKKIEKDVQYFNQVMFLIIPGNKMTESFHGSLARLANELNAKIFSYTKAEWTCIWANHGADFDPTIHELYRSAGKQRLENRRVLLTVFPGVLCTLPDGTTRTCIHASVVLIPQIPAPVSADS